MIEKIKNVLGEELAKQVELKLGDIELGITNDGSLVPAQKHEAMKVELKQSKEELEQVNTKLKETNSKIETISKDSELAEKYKQQLEELKADHENFQKEAEKRLTNVSKTAAIEKALLNENANPEALELLTTKFDLEKIELDADGKVKDWDNVVKPLRESKKSLFGEKIIIGTNPHPGTNPEPSTYQSRLEEAKKSGTNLDVIKIKMEAAENGINL